MKLPLRTERLFCLGVAVLTVTAAGCASSTGHFGGRPFPVTVKSVPAGATLYVIPNTVWDKYRTDLFTDKDLQDKLDLYRVNTSVSPIEVTVEAKTYMLVVDNGGKRTTQLYTPRMPHETVPLQAIQ